MHVPALDGVFYIHKICDGAGGWLRGACTIVVDWGTGLPVFCGEPCAEIFQVCCGDVVFQVVPGQICVYDAVGGRDGSLAVGGAVVDLLLGPEVPAMMGRAGVLVVLAFP